MKQFCVSTRKKRRSPLWLPRLGRWLVLTVLLVIFLLPGCTSGALSIDVNLSLYEDESWKVSSETVFHKLEMHMVGNQLEDGVQLLVDGWRAQGIQVSISKRTLANGNVRFRLKANGEGFERLNQVFFDGQPVFQIGPGVDQPIIHFNYYPMSTFFGAALSRRFTLSAGDIVSSNGASTRRGQVSWINPVDTLSATFTPAKRINPSVLFGIAGATVTAALLGLLLRRAGRKSCPFCGFSIPRSAGFCPVCGSNLRPRKIVDEY